MKLGRRWASSLHRFHVFSFAPALFVFTDVCTDAGHKNKVTQWLSLKEPLGVSGNLLRGADWQETRRVPETKTMTKHLVAPLTRQASTRDWDLNWTHFLCEETRWQRNCFVIITCRGDVIDLLPSWSVSGRVFKCQVGVTHLGSADSCCRSSVGYTMLVDCGGGMEQTITDRLEVSHLQRGLPSFFLPSNYRLNLVHVVFIWAVCAWEREHIISFFNMQC